MADETLTYTPSKPSGLTAPAAAFIESFVLGQSNNMYLWEPIQGAVGVLKIIGPTDGIAHKATIWVHGSGDGLAALSSGESKLRAWLDVKGSVGSLTISRLGVSRTISNAFISDVTYEKTASSYRISISFVEIT